MQFYKTLPPGIKYYGGFKPDIEYNRTHMYDIKLEFELFKSRFTSLKKKTKVKVAWIQYLEDKLPRFKKRKKRI